MHVRRTTARDGAALAGLIAAAPYGNHLLEARVQRDSGGEVWGCWESDRLCGAAYLGAAIFPSVLGADCQAALAARLPDSARTAGSITGERATVLGFWERLAPLWPSPARLIRASQPFLLLERRLELPAGSPVRPAVEAELAAYTAAGAMMFIGEIEAAPPLRALQQRYLASIRAGHSFAAVTAGRVYFKCDIGFVNGDIAHLQGVWLAPELRGQGRAAELLAGALAQIQTQVAPRVSLYVNDFNEPALALYRRLGFEQVDEYATVFF